MALCDEAGVDADVRDTVYWVALLRYVGCTGHAHEVATLFGDEIAIRAQTLVHDAANPAEVMRDVVAYATAGKDPEETEQIVQMIQEGAHEWAVYNFASGCEIGDMLLERLDFGPDVRAALACTFERWNGNGFPDHVQGEAIPLSARIMNICDIYDALRSRRPYKPALGHERVVDIISHGDGRTLPGHFDPVLLSTFIQHHSMFRDVFDAFAD